MTSIVSSALYIDFSRLPPPKVIEEIDYEELVKIYQGQVVGKLPTLAKAVELQQSPTNVILQAEAYGEMLVRARVNAAARAVMLAFATGSDLDHLAAFYDEGREPLVANPRNVDLYPEDWESDERFRRVVQLAPEAFTTTGSEGAYIYHALKADVTLRDASAMVLDRNGSVKVTIMNSGSDPTPTPVQIENVRERQNRKSIKPLTTVVTVASPKVKRTAVLANVTLYPGPDQGLVFTDQTKNVTTVRDRLSRLGRNLTRSALIAALNVEGVLGVDLPTPAADIVAAPDECVVIESSTINFKRNRDE